MLLKRTALPTLTLMLMAMLFKVLATLERLLKPILVQRETLMRYRLSMIRITLVVLLQARMLPSPTADFPYAITALCGTESRAVIPRRGLTSVRTTALEWHRALLGWLLALRRRMQHGLPGVLCLASVLCSLAAMILSPPTSDRTPFIYVVMVMFELVRRMMSVTSSASSVKLW